MFEDIKYIGVLVFVLFLGIFIGNLFGKIKRYKTIKEDRKASVKRSKSVILGEVYEKVLPFMPDFKYKPKDMVFVGKGVDYIIFDGLNEGNVKQVVFLELKSGKSRLNKNEKMIRDIISEKKIKYVEHRV